MPLSNSKVCNVGMVDLFMKRIGIRWTRQAMRKFLTGVRRNAEHTLNRELPQRAQFLKTVDASAAEAMKLMPELKDAKSERRQLFDTLLRNGGDQVRQFAGWPKALAFMVMGIEAQAKAAQAQQTPAAKPKRPLPVVIPAARGAVPTMRATRQTQNDDLGERAVSGDKRARLQYLQSLVPKMQ